MPTQWLLEESSSNICPELFKRANQLTFPEMSNVWKTDVKWWQHHMTLRVRLAKDMVFIFVTYQPITISWVLLCCYNNKSDQSVAGKLQDREEVFFQELHCWWMESIKSVISLWLLFIYVFSYHFDFNSSNLSCIPLCMYGLHESRWFVL